MKLFTVYSVKEAIAQIVQRMGELGLNKTERVATEDGLHRILAEDIVAPEDMPAFRKSTMDGYAVQSKATGGATEAIPSVLEVVEKIPMGEIPKSAISSSQASIISTGGMLPEGSDGVVPVEYTEQINEDLVGIYKPISYLENVVEVGEDTKQGFLYFKKGARVTPQVIAACMSLGIVELEVYKKLTARTISTGDEIVPPGEKLPMAKARDVNSYSIRAMLEKLGCDVVERKHVEDQRDLLAAELTKKDVDLIVISGSSSKGEKDYVPTILEEDLNPGLHFQGISIKPGKPTSFATDDRKMVVGLPGHPVSAMAVFQTIFIAAFHEFYGMEDLVAIPCRIDQNVSATLGRSKIQFVSAQKTEDGWTCKPIFGASGNLSTLAKANGYFVIPAEHEGVNKDQVVDVYLFTI